MLYVCKTLYLIMGYDLQIDLSLALAVFYNNLQRTILETP